MGTGSPPSLPSLSARAGCSVLCGVFDVVANELPVKPRKCGVSNGHGSGKGARKHDVLVFWEQKTAGGWRGFAPVARVIGAEVYLQAHRLPPDWRLPFPMCQTLQRCPQGKLRDTHSYDTLLLHPARCVVQVSKLHGYLVVNGNQEFLPLL